MGWPTAVADFARAETLDHAMRFDGMYADGSTFTFVILGILQADDDGRHYALACPEDELGDDDAVVVFEVDMNPDRSGSLRRITDEDRYDEVLHWFADLFGLYEGDADEDEEDDAA